VNGEFAFRHCRVSQKLFLFQRVTKCFTRFARLGYGSVIRASCKSCRISVHKRGHRYRPDTGEMFAGKLAVSASAKNPHSAGCGIALSETALGSERGALAPRNAMSRNSRTSLPSKGYGSNRRPRGRFHAGKNGPRPVSLPSAAAHGRWLQGPMDGPGSGCF
jgi:hypothetical protein